MKSIKTIIADDHTLLLEGIAELIREKVNIIALCKNGKEVLKVLEEETADLLITDINMPIMDGITLCSEVKKQYPMMKVMMLSMYEEQHIVKKAMQNGADAYMSKVLSQKEMILAIEQCMMGKKYISERIAIPKYKKPTDSKNIKSRFHISDREYEILNLLLEEKSNSEIGAILKISTRTVEAHKRNIMLKLNINTTAGLLKFAMKHIA